MIKRLGYVSTCRIPGSAVEIAGSLQTIISASRRNNSPVGVTGALLYNAGCFAQVLEGPEAALDAVYARISADPRHDAIRVLVSEFTDTRLFGAWAMALLNREGMGLRVSALATRAAYDPARMDGAALLTILPGLLERAALAG